MDKAELTPRSTPASGPSSRFSELFTIDPRSLALFRIGLGLVLLIDLVIRASDFQAMYSDEGMFSRAVICRHVTIAWNWSLHFGSGAWGYQVFLFGVAGRFRGGLVSRIRNAVGHDWGPGSCLFRSIIAYRQSSTGATICSACFCSGACFCPWDMSGPGTGVCCKGEGPQIHRWRPVRSIASAGIMLQMGMMYLFTAISKSNADWWSGGAVAGALAHDMYARPFWRVVAEVSQGASSRDFWCLIRRMGGSGVSYPEYESGSADTRHQRIDGLAPRHRTWSECWAFLLDLRCWAHALPSQGVSGDFPGCAFGRRVLDPLLRRRFRELRALGVWLP